MRILADISADIRAEMRGNARFSAYPPSPIRVRTRQRIIFISG